MPKRKNRAVTSQARTEGGGRRAAQGQPGTAPGEVGLPGGGSVRLNTGKLREALVELQHQRAILDRAIQDLQNIIEMMNGVAPYVGYKRRQRSYIDDGVAVLEQTGEPMHIIEIAKKIGEIHGREVSRGSVDSTFSRYIRSVGNRSRIIRVRHGYFGLTAWNAVPPKKGSPG